MTLPYNPRKDQAIAIAPLLTTDNLPKRSYTISACNHCHATILINKATADFMAKHETPAVCPDCAARFAKGE